MALSGPRVLVDPRAEAVGTLAENLGPILTTLLECSVAALDPTPALAFVTSGIAPAWDNCCDGMIWTRVQSIEMTRPPTMGMTPGDPCRRSWLATIGVGVLRCAAGMTGNDGAWVPPPASAITADAMQVLADEAAVLNAVHCCVPPSTAMKSLAAVRWDALGPDGGCVGGEWTVNVVIQTYECAPSP